MNNCCKDPEDSKEPKEPTEPKEPKILPDLKKVLVSRDEFLKLLSITLGVLIAFIAGLPGVAFIFNYVFIKTRKKWINVGAVEKYKEGQTVDVVFEDPEKLPWDGVTGKRSAWLRRVEGESFLAFAVNCTHLGCPVKWEAGAELFMCPCHGGVYYSNGEVAGGPPPRPLHQYPVRIADGMVEIEVRPVLGEG